MSGPGQMDLISTTKSGTMIQARTSKQITSATVYYQTMSDNVPLTVLMSMLTALGSTVGQI